MQMLNWQKHVPLAPLSSWKIGGSAEYFVEPSSDEELCQTVHCAKQKGIPLTILGAGSNVLIADQGISGVVVRLGKKYSRISVDDTVLTVEAGAYMPCVAHYCMLNGLSGLEHTIGIPGSVGGLTYMNGGSMRHCLSENLLSVRALELSSLKMKDFTVNQCGFAYRESMFQNNQYVISRLRFKLSHSSIAEVRSSMLSILRDRRDKFPLRMPSCGSVFKSDPEFYAQFGAPGKIIESLNLKGVSIGGAMVSPKHANFIVNFNHATAQDVLQLTQFIVDKVRQATGWTLTPEYKTLL